ncbi:uncharacterized protein LOC129791590 [Lutzomyia longipalpis]|uniref:uncharacterized protein LOC129791590 n=1 Tax=Lutzomyia longipalpis TaxID=7200 RepID=UPI002483D07F|nr:uncharacterized protein LOC129791590 [Lutzomyia longipalpis]
MPKNPGSQPRSEVSQSLVGAWKNKLEFKRVYEGIYRRNADTATKRKSLIRMKIWKSRLMTLTPSSILATLSILEVSVKDAEKGINDQDLRAMYSTALVRFLNYIHSSTRSTKSFYSVAKDLGLASFVVDLRHLCSHGQSMPSLKIFRQTFTYCLKWLKSFYWEPQLHAMQDAKIEDVKRNNKTAFERNLRTLFIAYDGVAEGMRRRMETLGQVCLQNTHQEFLHWVFTKDFSQKEKLPDLAEKLLGEIFAAISAEQQVREIAQIFTEAFLECSCLIKAPAVAEKEDEDGISVTVIHQMLFRKIAEWAFISNCLTALIEIAECETENEVRRKGAAFWSQRLIEGFMAFQELKCVYKKNKDADSSLNLDFSTINTPSVDGVILEAYEEMGIIPETSLIFSDSLRRPWCLRFSWEFIKKRALRASEVTLKIFESCLQLSDAPLDAKQQENLLGIARKVFSEQEAPEGQTDEKIYTLEDVLGAKTRENADLSMGIWHETPKEIDWSSCPLGSLPW